VNRRAASVATERAALAASARALRGLLPRPGMHARGCPGVRGRSCTFACARGREALEAVRAVLFPWWTRKAGAEHHKIDSRREET